MPYLAFSVPNLVTMCGLGGFESLTCKALIVFMLSHRAAELRRLYRPSY